MHWTTTKQGADTLALVRRGALDPRPIAGLTHCFYRYPARFSPAFARACIEAFSEQGQLVLDPYMGGGTTVLEALVLGRRAIGSDINSLAVFVARAKVVQLDRREKQALVQWVEDVVPRLRCNHPDPGATSDGDRLPKNLTMPDARWLKKTISLCIASVERTLPTARSRTFARCVLLNVGQWALNGRRQMPTAAEFRERVVSATHEMLIGGAKLSEAVVAADIVSYPPLLFQSDAERIDHDPRIRGAGQVDLVVTSPPYPGIHMLYHRWQVDGRKETDAPYWIARCTDGSGAAYYNFADRKVAAEARYFEKAERSFAAIRRVMRPGALLAQMIAFSEPRRQLSRYLDMMERAGFKEMQGQGGERTWRMVPSRRWHANFKGELASSKEVVLLHIAT